MSQPVFAHSPLCCALSRDATNNNVLSFWRDPIWARTFGAIVDVNLYNHCVHSNPVHGEVFSIQYYVIKFFIDCYRSEVLSGYYGFLHQ